MEVPIEFPSWVIAACKKANAKHPTSSDKALEAAYQTVEQHKDFAQVRENLIRKALLAIIHDVRHAENQQRIRGMRQHVKEPLKLAPESRKQIARTERLYWGFYLAGRQLGGMLYGEVAAYIEMQKGVVKGEARNLWVARLTLEAHKDNGKTVRQNIKLNRIKEIFAEAERRAELAAA